MLVCNCQLAKEGCDFCMETLWVDWGHFELKKTRQKSCCCSRRLSIYSCIYSFMTTLWHEILNRLGVGLTACVSEQTQVLFPSSLPFFRADVEERKGVTSLRSGRQCICGTLWNIWLYDWKEPGGVISYEVQLVSAEASQIFCFERICICSFVLKNWQICTNAIVGHCLRNAHPWINIGTLSVLTCANCRLAACGQLLYK